MMSGVGINTSLNYTTGINLIFKWRRVRVQAHYLPNLEAHATSSQGFLSYKRTSLFALVTFKVLL